MNRRNKIILDKIVQESAALAQIIDGLDSSAFLLSMELPAITAQIKEILETDDGRTFKETETSEDNE